MMSWGRETKLREPETMSEESLCSPHRAGQPWVSPENGEKWKCLYFKVFFLFFLALTYKAFQSRNNCLSLLAITGLIPCLLKTILCV